ncbi:isochorismatase family protein [Polynucleobacter sp. AP-Kaivos-20-H2]|jgi:nicotinamidase-related amidase|uniref:isochorismatase family protein n=1 Tax=Polynucleobacter sp. AP-Kaivos-20-H2 TaxID=2689104 RepID=UPI001C0B58D9|nr:isochorismatase family protein [Polynucleobacter sp. AP-Kaivos-20-H2]MBU3604032.1 isochorismatase family protein [Polynucleobacter sp. AP-Kaivos-20-H2]
MFNPTTSVLILVDYQTRLLPSIHNGESVVDEALFLAKLTRILDIPIFGTEQNPEGLGPNDRRIRGCCDQTLLKFSFDATKNGLLELIQKVNPLNNQVVLAGCETHVCLMQTALGLREKSFEVAVIPEACGSRSPNDKMLGIARMQQQGIAMLSTEMIVFEWLQNSRHAQFKNILQLIKSRVLKD